MQAFNWIKARLIFYPTLLWNVVLGRWLKLRNWRDPIDDHVVLGAFPFSKDVSELAAEGVKAVVNTCEEYAGPQKEYARYGIEQMRMPTIDFTHPSFVDVNRAVDFIQENVDAGKTVYIHCKAGRGRSATVAICWLMKSKQISADAAQKWLIEKRPHVNHHLPSRPVVQEFERKFVNLGQE